MAECRCHGQASPSRNEAAEHDEDNLRVTTLPRHFDLRAHGQGDCRRQLYAVLTRMSRCVLISVAFDSTLPSVEFACAEECPKLGLFCPISGQLLYF